MKIERQYYPYCKRVVLQIYQTILLLLILLPIIVGVSIDAIQFALLIAVLPSVLILLITSLLLNKLYLKSIKFNEAMSNVVLTYYKYNKKQEVQIELKYLDIRVSQVLISMHKYYKIQFYSNKSLIFKQREFKNWNKETFDQIVSYFKELKTNNDL